MTSQDNRWYSAMVSHGLTMQDVIRYNKAFSVALALDDLKVSLQALEREVHNEDSYPCQETNT